MAEQVDQYRANRSWICFSMTRLISRLPGEEQLSDPFFLLAAGMYAHCIEDDLSLKVQAFVLGHPDPPMGFDEGMAWLRRELPNAKQKSAPTVIWEWKAKVE